MSSCIALAVTWSASPNTCVTSNSRSSTTPANSGSGVPSARITTGSLIALSFTCCRPSTMSPHSVVTPPSMNRQYGRLPPASAFARWAAVIFSIARS